MGTFTPSSSDRSNLTPCLHRRTWLAQEVAHPGRAIPSPGRDARRARDDISGVTRIFLNGASGAGLIVSKTQLTNSVVEIVRSTVAVATTWMRQLQQQRSPPAHRRRPICSGLPRSRGRSIFGSKLASSPSPSWGSDLSTNSETSLQWIYA